MGRNGVVRAACVAATVWAAGAALRGEDMIIEDGVPVAPGMIPGVMIEPDETLVTQSPPPATEPPNTAPAPVRPAGPPPSAKDIRRAIENLASSSDAVRDAAWEVLERGGPAAAEPLKAALAKATEAELRENLTRALERLEQAALEPPLGAPPETKSLIARYREDRNTREQMAQNLCNSGSIGAHMAIRLGEAEQDPAMRTKVLTVVAEGEIGRLADALCRGDATAVDPAGDLAILARRLTATPEAPALGEYPAHWAALVVADGQAKDKIAELKARLAENAAPKEDRAADRRLLMHLYRAAGEYQEARKLAADVPVATDPAADIHADILLALGDWPALVGHRKAQLAKPAPVGAPVYGLHAALAFAQQQAGDEAGAKATLKTLLEKAHADKNPEAVGQAIHALTAIGAVSEALEFSAERDAEAHMNLLIALGRHREALTYAGALATDHPAYVPIQLLRVRTLHDLGESAEVSLRLAPLAAMVKKADTPALWSSYIQTLARVGKREQAMDAAAACLEDKPDWPWEKAYDLVVAAFPENGPQAYVWWAYFRYGDEQKGTLRETFGRVAKVMAGQWPRDQFPELCHRAMAKIRERNGFEQLSTDASARELGRMLRQQGHENVALEMWESQPGDAETFAEDLLPYYRQHQLFDAALGVAQRGRTEFGWTTPADAYRHGRLLVQAKRTQDGDPMLARAQRAMLANATTGDELMTEALREGDREEALRLARRCVQTSSSPQAATTAAVLDRAANAAFELKRYREAATLRRRHVAVLPIQDGQHTPQAAWALLVDEAYSAIEAGKLDDAMAWARRTRDLGREHVDLAADLIAALEKAGRKDDAEAFYRQRRDRLMAGVQAFPCWAQGHNELAWLQARTRRDLDDALAHARKATELSPDDANCLDTLAATYFARGERDQAIATQKQAIERAPDRPSFREQLKRFEGK